MEIPLPFGKFSSFQSLIISRKQLPEIKFQMTTTISFGRFIDFGKTLTIVQRSSQPLHSDKWYAVNLCLAYRRFHGRGRHLGSRANAAKFTVTVWGKS